MESFLWFAVVSGNVTTLGFVEGLLTLSNAYENVFEIINSRKLRGNAHDPFGLKSFFSCTNIRYNFLAKNKLWATLYISLAKYLKTRSRWTDSQKRPLFEGQELQSQMQLKDDSETTWEISEMSLRRLL